MSRFPLAKQGISSQDSGYSEGIGLFTRDPCKFHLKSDLQPTIHASQKQEIPLQVNTENVNTHWVHSHRMEHAKHFPAPMEMCMNDHHTQTTERTQQQHLQDIGHAEFPPGMESTPVFPGDQFQQGNEKIMDTGTFTLGNTILNRYPALSTHTHQGMENSNMEAFPSFNFYADATPQMKTSRKGPRADSTPSGKDPTVTSSRVTPMDPMDDIQPPTRKCISQTSVHFQDSLSNQSDQLLKSKVQGNQLTGLSHQFNTDFCCDEKRNDRDLHRSWNDREQLSNTTLNTTSMTTIQAHRYRRTEKEAHLLSRPSELQLPDDLEAQKLRSSTQVQQPRKEYSRFTETEKAKFQTPSTYNDDRNFVRHNSVEKFLPHRVYPTKSDTSSVSDSIFFRKKGGNCRRHSCTCRRHACTCTCTCTHTGDSQRMTTHSRIKKVNKELWEASQHI